MSEENSREKQRAAQTWGVNNEKFLQACNEVVGVRARQGITRQAKEKIAKDRFWKESFSNQKRKRLEPSANDENVVIDRGKQEPYLSSSQGKWPRGWRNGWRWLGTTRSGQQKQRARQRHLRKARVSGNTLSLVETE